MITHFWLLETVDFRSTTHLNDEHIDTTENLDLIMNMYNLIEYSENYADTTSTLYQFKR